MAKAKKKPAKKGPPLELTKAQVAEICASVQLGAFVSAACLAAGFSRRSYQRWLRVGTAAMKKKNAALSEPERMYVHFTKEYRKALGKLECETTHKYLERSETSAERLVEFLERRFPKRWKKVEESKTKIDHSGNISQTQTHIYLPAKDASESKPA